MSVLIKGMKMPKNCDMCILAVPVFDYAKHKHISICLLKNSNGCPLVEVPTPHGRLIDGDELKERVKQTMRYFSIKYDIDEAPTVIESEEKNERID